MKMLKVVALLLALSASSYAAPWCGVTNGGTMDCFYWTLSACLASYGHVECVFNPNG